MKTQLSKLLAAATLVAVTPLIGSGQSENNSAKNPKSQETKGNSQSSEMESFTLRYPPGSAVLELQAKHPAEKRVGEEFPLHLTVKNVTDNIALQDIKLVETSGSQIQLQSVSVEQTKAGNKSKSQRGMQQSTQQGSRKTAKNNREKGQDQNKKPSQDSQKASQKTDSKSSGNSNQDKPKVTGSFLKSNRSSETSSQQNTSSQDPQESDQKNWTISQLMPGESVKLQLKAVSDSEGNANFCLAVASYQPSICLTTKFVKPEIEFVKKAPETANRCSQIEVQYFVRNSGSGKTGALTIRDELASGLKTSEGKEQLKFEVDGLKPGETRKFVANLQATRAGTFSSRAVVEQKGGGTTKSKETTTEVKQADLIVGTNVAGNAYIDQPLSYAIRVANRGNAAAENVKLRLMLPDSAQIAQSGDLSSFDYQGSQSNPSSAQRPTPADQNSAEKKRLTDPFRQKQLDRRQTNQNDNGQDKESGLKEAEVWEVGTLKPGEGREVRVTLRPGDAGKFNQRVIVESDCEIDTEKSIPAQSVAKDSIEVIALPALRLMVTDNHDPVQSKEEVTYTIEVLNQGDAADHDLELSANLPKDLKFVSADGPAKVTQQGQSLTFQQIDKLDAGDELSFEVTCKSVSDTQDVLFEVELESQGLGRKATAEEPTQLIR